MRRGNVNGKVGDPGNLFEAVPLWQTQRFANQSAKLADSVLDQNCNIRKRPSDRPWLNSKQLDLEPKRLPFGLISMTLIRHSCIARSLGAVNYGFLYGWEIG